MKFGPTASNQTVACSPPSIWQQYLPDAKKISPCIIAMVRFDGPLRFTNIWAYPTRRAQQGAADAVAQGRLATEGWPGHGSPRYDFDHRAANARFIAIALAAHARLFACLPHPPVH